MSESYEDQLKKFKKLIKENQVLKAQHQLLLLENELQSGIQENLIEEHKQLMLLKKQLEKTIRNERERLKKFNNPN
ncbi:MAG: hypothetical protein ACK4ND_06840 [Cytophagaceae bacterium]